MDATSENLMMHEMLSKKLRMESMIQSHLKSLTWISKQMADEGGRLLSANQNGQHTDVGFLEVYCRQYRQEQEQIQSLQTQLSLVQNVIDMMNY